MVQINDPGLQGSDASRFANAQRHPLGGGTCGPRLGKSRRMDAFPQPGRRPDHGSAAPAPSVEPYM